MDDQRSGEILDIVSKETNVPREKLGADVKMDTLGIPSLDMVQAIFALESHFDIEIPVASNQTGSEFATVGDLVRHVNDTINAKRTGVTA